MLAEAKCGVNPRLSDGAFAGLGQGCLSVEEE